MKPGLEKIKPRRLEALPDGESKRPRVGQGLDPTVWWLAVVNLEIKAFPFRNRGSLPPS